MSSAAGEALEVFALVTYVTGAVPGHSRRVLRLLYERVHVSAQRHSSAALGSLHL